MAGSQARLKIIALVIIGLSPMLFGAEITSIDFAVEGPNSVIRITSDEQVNYTQSDSLEGQQFTLNIDGSTFGPNASRRLDTSSFNSPVKLISQYEVDGQARIVVELNQTAAANVVQNGNVLEVTIPNGASADEAAPETADFPEDDFDSDLPETVNDDLATMDADGAGDGSAPPQDKLDSFLSSRQSKNFQGSPITLQVRDADVRDILRLISETSGFNIIVGPDVSGKVSLSLIDVPWDQALDVTLETLKLGAERNNNVLRIVTLSNLKDQKQGILEAQLAAEASAPRVTRVFPISYADPGELKGLLEKFGKSGLQSGIKTGSVEVDQRTNSIVVQDIQENVDRMAKLIELLDTQTPQVLIESKVVEATENFNFGINGSSVLFSGAENTDFPYQFAFNGRSPVEGLLGSGPTGVGPEGGGGGFLGPTLSFIPGSLTLQAFIDMNESEDRIRVVSSPRSVVLNKQSSKILQTEPVIFQRTFEGSEGGQITETQLLEAVLSLEVTPTITNDEGVLMDLKITRDVPQEIQQNSAIAKRNMETKVLVQSGSTLVIGGIYTMRKSRNESGFPFLKDIPIIGHLFGSSSIDTSRTELFIFISPKIINARKAGLSG